MGILAQQNTDFGRSFLENLLYSRKKVKKKKISILLRHDLWPVRVTPSHAS